MVADEKEENEEGSLVVVKRTVELPLKKVKMFEEQPREYFNRSELNELAQSIKAHGLQNPIRVRKLSPEEVAYWVEKGKAYKWEAIDGQRRYMAHELLKRKTIEATIVIVKDRKDQFVQSIIANCARIDFTPEEKARAVRRLHQEFGYSGPQIATIFACSLPSVHQYMQLIKLDEVLMKRLSPAEPEESRLNVSGAIALSTLPPKDQIELVDRIAVKGMTMYRARHIVEQHCHKHGIERDRRGRSPRKDWNVLSGFSQRTLQAAKVLVEKPVAFFAEMMEYRSVEELQGLEARLRAICSEINELATLAARNISKKKKGESLLPPKPAPAIKPAPAKQEPAGKNGNGNGNGKKPKKPEKPSIPALTPGQLKDRMAHQTAMDTLGRQRQVEEEARRATAEETALRAAAEEAARETPGDQARALREALEWKGKKVKPETKVVLASPLLRPKFKDPLIDG